MVHRHPAAPCRSQAEIASTSGGPYFWRVVIPTALVMLVCNMDRICMSVAVLPMAKLFEWSPSVQVSRYLSALPSLHPCSHAATPHTPMQGMVGAAFLWGYMATQLVGGRLADMYGGRRVIGGAIAFFSLASVLPPLLADIVPAGSVLTLVIVSRFLGLTSP